MAYNISWISRNWNHSGFLLYSKCTEISDSWNSMKIICHNMTFLFRGLFALRFLMSGSKNSSLTIHWYAFTKILLVLNTEVSRPKTNRPMNPLKSFSNLIISLGSLGINTPFRTWYRLTAARPLKYQF